MTGEYLGLRNLGNTEILQKLSKGFEVLNGAPKESKMAIRSLKCSGNQCLVSFITRWTVFIVMRVSAQHYGHEDMQMLLRSMSLAQKIT